jgi:hypothetical protein
METLVSEEAEHEFDAGNSAKQAADYVGAISHYTKGLETATSVVLRCALHVNRSKTLAQLGRDQDIAGPFGRLGTEHKICFSAEADAERNICFSAEADATLCLAAALTVLKQDPKNEDSKIQAKAIREEIEALRAEERRAQSQTQQQTAKDVRGPEISRAAKPSLLSMRLEAMFARRQAAEQQKTANAGEKEEAVSLNSKPIPHEEVAEDGC